ncbi:HD domain-containing protein [Niabella ginsengisoli]|uniref:HD domain-containing protein n=1 Tax=Niabella ginsengisoli TaxID=522298 RepID=A0ABS9SGT1_9BACT|nr:HD domain-containing protein [Niabella ginsengisoli]MCH5597531.1 HD domain-containing protein [Niabella ginsengisoli]
MDLKSIQQAIGEYVSNYFDEQHSEDFSYHNLEHTTGVVAATAELSDHYNLSEREKFIAQAAAWFHDLGYFVDADNHEAESMIMAANFLREKNVDGVTIEEVKSCIKATKMPQKPKNLLEQIVCDADMSHFSTNSFSDKSKRLRKELQSRCGLAISKDAWRHQTICLLEVHKYHTDYARDNWNVKKWKIY